MAVPAPPGPRRPGAGPGGDRSRPGLRPERPRRFEVVPLGPPPELSRRSQSGEGVLDDKGIPETDTFQLSPVLQVLAQQQGRSGLLGDRPLHGIPERKVVLFDGSHGEAQACGRGGDHWEESLPIFDLGCRLGGCQLTLARCCCKEFAQRLQRKEAVVAQRPSPYDLAPFSWSSPASASMV